MAVLHWSTRRLRPSSVTIVRSLLAVASRRLFLSDSGVITRSTGTAILGTRALGRWALSGSSLGYAKTALRFRSKSVSTQFRLRKDCSCWRPLLILANENRQSWRRRVSVVSWRIFRG